MCNFQQKEQTARWYWNCPGQVRKSTTIGGTALSGLKVIVEYCCSHLIVRAFFLCFSLFASVDAVSQGEQVARASENQRPNTKQRIISLAPHITELLFSLEVGERIVGTVSYSDFPEAASEIPRVGDAANFDLEAIIALRPDLVIAWQSGTPGNAVQRLKSLGLKVHLVESGGLLGIADNLVKLGQLVDKEELAHSQAKKFKATVRELRRHYHRDRPLRVFYQIWHQPLMTVNDSHAIDDVIEVCGGKNLFAALPSLAPQVNLEAVISGNPDVILISSGAAENDDVAKRWRKWSQIVAVRKNQIYSIPWDLISRQSLRILEGAEFICEALANADVR